MKFSTTSSAELESRRATLQLFDPTDIATDTNEVGYVLTQRFYARSKNAQPCTVTDAETATTCAPQPREWADWVITQKYFLDPTFGGAAVSGRRNVFDTTFGFDRNCFSDRPEESLPACLATAL